jgi:hypothetical protein
MKSINIDFVYQSVLPPYASKKLPTANSQNTHTLCGMAGKVGEEANAYTNSYTSED